MEEVGKKNNYLVVILLLLLVAASGFIVYDKFIKKEDVIDNGSNTQEIMSNELAIALAKEKLKAANTFLSDFQASSCQESLIKEDFYCYYGSKDIFDDSFYSIYSKKLSIKDVYIEHDFKTKKESTNIVGIEENTNTNDIDNDTSFVLHYAISDNGIYVDSSCRASGHGTEVQDFKIDSLTDDKIEVSYILREDLNEVLLGITDEKEIERLTKAYNNISEFGRHKMVLINEDGTYKISSAVLLDNCGHVYKVGK